MFKRQLHRPAGRFGREARTSLALSAALTACFLAASPGCNCGGHPGAPDGGGTSVGPAGGLVASTSCPAGLAIPPGALTKTLTFTISRVSSAAPHIDGRMPTSPVCQIDPPTSFLLPAVVTVVYDPALIPAGSQEQDTDVRVVDAAGQLARLRNFHVDGSKKAVSADTSKTGKFFSTVPGTPPPVEIDISPTNPVSVQLGATQQYTAVVKDATGQTLSNPSITWAVDPARVGTLDATGLFTGTGIGHAQVVAASGPALAQVDVYVQSAVPSPARFDWENPQPQGNDIHGISVSDGGQVEIGAANGTVLVSTPTGGFDRILSASGLGLVGAAIGAGRLATAGNLDVVQQGVEQIAGVTMALDQSSTDLKVLGPSDLAPRAIYGDADGVLVVGSGNDAYVLTAQPDAGWVPLETPVSEALIAAGADPTQGRRVVGARGQVYRQQGADWFPIWDTSLGTLFSHAAVVGHDAYAVDYGLNLRHFVEGQGWQADQLPSALPLDHVSFLGHLGTSLALGAVDTQQASHLYLRAQAGTWQEVPGLDPGDELFAAGALTATDGWVGGKGGALYRFNGGGLAPARQGPLDDVTGLSAASGGSVYASALGACISGNLPCTSHLGALLARQPDGRWTVAASVGVGLYGVSARAATEVWAVGEAGSVYRFDGTTAQKINQEATATLHAVRRCGTALWIAGERGTLSSYNGAKFEKAVGVSTNADLFAIACTSENNVYVAGDQTLLHFNGQGWTSLQPSGFSLPTLRAAWVDDYGVMAGGDATYLIHYDGANWETFDRPAELFLGTVSAIWASQPGDLYVAGMQQQPAQGVLLRFDGAEWTMLDAGTDHGLLAIDGTGPGKIWIGGKGGALLKSEPPSP